MAGEQLGRLGSERGAAEAEGQLGGAAEAEEQLGRLGGEHGIAEAGHGEVPGGT